MHQLENWEVHDVSLLELLDRVLDKGVYVWGELTISVADVDLLYIGLKALICSVEKAEQMRMAAQTKHFIDYEA